MHSNTKLLTEVILEGPLGKAFGRKWQLAISSPAEALRMVDVNRPGVFAWIRQNLEKYDRYKIICEYEGGRADQLDIDGYSMQGKPVRIRFVPIVEGAGATGRVILGAALVAAGMVATAYGNPITGKVLFSVGVSLIVGGVIEMLSPQPKMPNVTNANDGTSHYFNGPVNTTAQGVPVQLIYGFNVMVGSHAISADVSIAQLL